VYVYGAILILAIFAKERKYQMNYTIILKLHGKKVERLETASLRLFYSQLRSIKWRKGTSVYCRVYYGKKLDHRGNLTKFYNDGEYETKDDLFQAIDAFLEE